VKLDDLVPTPGVATDQPNAAIGVVYDFVVHVANTPRVAADQPNAAIGAVHDFVVHVCCL